MLANFSELAELLSGVLETFWQVDRLCGLHSFANPKAPVSGGEKSESKLLRRKKEPKPAKEKENHSSSSKPAKCVLKDI